MQMQNKMNLEITKYRIDFPEPISKPGQFIGIDPGTVNLGIAEIVTVGVSRCHIYQIRMPRVRLIERIDQLHTVLSTCIRTYNHNYMYGIIEGASYVGYRQVELAEVRAICALWLYQRMMTDKIAVHPPLSIRKKVFGRAKIKAEEVFITDEPIPDALAALSCAYLASFFEW